MASRLLSLSLLMPVVAAVVLLVGSPHSVDAKEPEYLPVEVERQTVDIRIQDGVARAAVAMTVTNPTGRPLEVQALVAEAHGLRPVGARTDRVPGDPTHGPQPVGLGNEARRALPSARADPGHSR